MVERQKYLHAVKGVVCLDFSQSESPRHVCRTRHKAEKARQAIDPASDGAFRVPVKWTLCEIPVLCLHLPGFESGRAGSGHHQGHWLFYRGHRGSMLSRLRFDYDIFWLLSLWQSFHYQ